MKTDKPSTRRRRFRSPEFWLLVLASVITLWSFGCAFLVRSNTGSAQNADWFYICAFITSVLMAHLILSVAGSRADLTLLPVFMVIAGFGISYQYRFGSVLRLDPRDLTCLVAMSLPLIIAFMTLIFRNGRLQVLQFQGWFFAVLTAAIPFFVLLKGVRFRGASYGPGLTTPTEFIKPFLVIFLSMFLANYGKSITGKTRLLSKKAMKTLALLISVWAVPQVLFLLQHDLGMVLISFFVLFVMLATATGRLIFPIAGIGGLAAAGLVFGTLFQRGLVRFQAWLTPFENPDSAGFQIVQALFAVFHGEFLGQGIGGGHPEKIPLVRTDFIFASIAEELGIAGSILIVFGLLYFARKAFDHASVASGPFISLLCIGSGTLIMVQVGLNIGGVLSLTPMTGIPLPFISQGGTAAVVFALIIGLIMAASDRMPVLKTERSRVKQGLNPDQKNDRKTMKSEKQVR
jgi:cell division protein FtsW (lipid II flippase)